MYNTALMEKDSLAEQKPRKGKKAPISPSEGPGIWMQLAVAFAVFLVLSAGYSAVRKYIESTSEEIAISQLAADIGQNLVETITVEGDTLKATYKDKSEKTSQKEGEAPFTETLQRYGLTPEKIASVKIEIQDQGGVRFWFLTLAPLLIPVLLLIGIMWFLSRQVRGAGMQAFTFGRSMARLVSPEDETQRVTFKDVAGAKEAKSELLEIVDFLKNPKKFIQIGARIPKGVLLMGAAGTGKTLLARAIAGEAGVPFFSISGSEFVEMFVGVGASVHSDTKILIRQNNSTKLLPIGKFADQFYQGDQEGFTVPVSDVQTIGVDFARGNKFFGSSAWKNIKAVYRHRVNKIYEIRYIGGKIEVTADHSVFIREKNYIIPKRTNELKVGDTLVSLPYKTRSLFIPGIGTTHKIKSHPFPTELPYSRLSIWTSEPAKSEASNYRFIPRSVAHAFQELRSTGATLQSVRSSVVAVNVNAEDTLSYFVPITRELCKLLGYYTAEGDYHARNLRFSFGSHESRLHEDCMFLLQQVFSQNPTLLHPHPTAVHISTSSVPIGEFFVRQCGTGAYNKHVPEFMWDMPREYFMSYLDGFVEGDGHINKKGLIEIASCSEQLVSELSWLLHMHGMPCSVTQYNQSGGRYIKNSKSPLPDTTHYRITVGKSANYLTENPTTDFGRKATIKEIIEKPYDGYVYDLCGVDNEAFFGGEKPILLHNSRVRDTFSVAKKAAPAILFIDEIDAIGRVRGSGVGGGNDEREQTLNQILVEMDGFEPNEKIVILAATNRPDVLDPALVRPGRFDRRVTIDLPDRKDREEILKVHARKKPLGPDVNLGVIAERTPGFSGADLANLMNEGAILAAREDRKELTQYDLIRSIEKVMLGPERRSHVLNKKEKEITAYHEAGHALVASVLTYADPVHKVSIISRGRAAGYTLKLPLEDRRMQSKLEFLDDIAVSLGGYIAEKMIFGDITTGASNDLQVLTALARDMVTKYGMSDKMGPMALEAAPGRTLFGVGIEQGELSENVTATIDSEVKAIVTGAYKRAEDVMKKHRKVLDAIAKQLIEVENIERAEFEKILIAHGIVPKKKQDIEHQPLA